MEEKIVEARITKNRLALIILLVSIAILTIGFIHARNTFMTSEIRHHSVWGNFYFKPCYEDYESFGEFFLEKLFNYNSDPDLWSEPLIFGTNIAYPYFVFLGISGVLVAIFFAWMMSKCTLTVTNRSVKGKTSFGKIVDIPLHKVSAVSLGFCKSIAVGTSSGKIHFWYVKNRDEVCAAITELIVNAQVEAAQMQNNTSVNSNADELKKYKELLDSGVISQEEFDAKKKQILGL